MKLKTFIAKAQKLADKGLANYPVVFTGCITEMGDPADICPNTDYYEDTMPDFRPVPKAVFIDVLRISTPRRKRK